LKTSLKGSIIHYKHGLHKKVLPYKLEYILIELVKAHCIQLAVKGIIL